ncbi:MAG: NUMOD1 domain-containing DNA-binding protein [Candidatus Kuenenia sp.]|nr:NUMOD1 domain-containing DNA-binding protein [Candidatus Kuenenia sp.]
METKKVKQIDLTSGMLMNIFSSVTEASKLTGVSKATISYCINRKKDSGRGFIWEALQDEEGTTNRSLIIMNEEWENKLLRRKYHRIKNMYKNAKIRHCLLCNAKFISIDTYNRRCDKCNSNVEHSKDSHFVYKHESLISSRCCQSFP